MIKKLRRRFVAVFMTTMSLIVIAVMVSVFIMVYSSETSRTIQRMEQISLSERVDMGRDFEDEPKDDIIPHADPLNRVEMDTFLVHFESSSVYPSSYEYHSNEDFDADELFDLAVKINLSVANETVSNMGIVEFNGSEYRYLMSKDSLVLVNRTAEKDAISRVAMPLLFAGIAAVAVFFAISILLARWTTKPIEKSWQKQKEFIADASHELKTPLTVIDANIDVVLNNKGNTVDSQERWLKNIKDETKSMSLLVNDLLSIAKSDANKDKFEPCEFNLSDTVENLVLGFESVAFEKGKVLSSNIQDNVTYTGDKDSIKQLVKILLDNAIKYSAEKGHIFVELKRNEKQKIHIVVSNDGELLSEADRKLVFERFYRTDKSRARVTGGSGLGLSIAKSIVDRHKGAISVEIIDNKYNSFVVTL